MKNHITTEIIYLLNVYSNKSNHVRHILLVDKSYVIFQRANQEH